MRAGSALSSYESQIENNWRSQDACELCSMGQCCGDFATVTTITTLWLLEDRKCSTKRKSFVGLSVLVIATFDDPVCRQPPAGFSLRPIFMLGGSGPGGVRADGARICCCDAGKRALGGGGDVRHPRGQGANTNQSDCQPAEDFRQKQTSELAKSRLPLGTQGRNQKQVRDRGTHAARS